MKLSKTQKEQIAIIISVIVLLVLGLKPIVTKVINDNELYHTLLEDVQNENWANAKNKVDTLGENYKDCNKLMTNINYHYYLDLGNKATKEKRYEDAINYLEKANNNNPKDANLILELTKIKKIKNEIDAENERKAKIEQEKAERIRIAKEKQELKDLTRLVNNTFEKVDCLDAGDTSSTGFNFYMIPEPWYSLSEEEQINVLCACARYIELKYGVTRHIARKYTRIINIESGWQMGSL